MKTWISRTAALCGVLAATSAWALIQNVSISLPGVNSSGNLSQELGALVPFKVNINTTNGKFKATGKGKVQNLSLVKHTYVNAPISIPNVTILTSKYIVAKDGKCSASASGVASPGAASN
jgi:hypothetical protein